MSYPLAVFSPWIGMPAQQYVRRHIDGILAQRTVALAIVALDDKAPAWTVDCPFWYVPPRLRYETIAFDSRTPVYDSLPAEHWRRFSSPALLDSAISFLKNHDVEVMLAQWMHPSLPLVAAARTLGIRYFVQTHGTDVAAAVGCEAVRGACMAYNEVDGVISPSDFGRKQLVDLGFDPGRVHVVRHGVQVPKDESPKPSAPVRCLAVGRMEAMKDPLGVIEIFSRARRVCPGLHLDYIGSGTLSETVGQTIRSRELGANVKLHGAASTEEVMRLMAASHILIHPSRFDPPYHRYDTCPVAVVEAMAWSNVVVGTRHGGIPEEIREGEEGFLCDEGDYDGMAERVIELAGDVGLRRKMASAAWRAAARRFSYPVMQREMRGLLGLG